MNEQLRRLFHQPKVFLKAEEFQRLLDDLNYQIMLSLSGIDKLSYTTQTMLELLAADEAADYHFCLFCPSTYPRSKLEWMIGKLRERSAAEALAKRPPPPQLSEAEHELLSFKGIGDHVLKKLVSIPEHELSVERVSRCRRTLARDAHLIVDLLRQHHAAKKR